MRIWPILGALALGACAPPSLVDNAAPGFDLTRYYAAAEAEIRANSGMRLDYAPLDAVFTRADLARNFMRIAMVNEFDTVDGRYVPSQSPARLRRFERPLVVRVVNGPATPETTAQLNLSLVAQYSRRLGRITGLDIRFAKTGERANMVVFFLNRAEQPRYARQLTRYVTAPPREVEADFANSPPDRLCSAFSLSTDAAPYRYSAAIILVKAEHSGAMRSACLQEEMAQALGLSNDSPQARPSLFNDDEEFAALTKHDELLLQILYDPRLSPGMSAAEVRPILPTIINDLWP